MQPLINQDSHNLIKEVLFLELTVNLDVEEGRLGILKNPSCHSKFYENSSLLIKEASFESNAFSVSHSGTLENGSNFDYGFNIDKRNFIGLEAKSGYRYGTFVNNTFFFRIIILVGP